jgi:hypothetical protein
VVTRKAIVMLVTVVAKVITTVIVITKVVLNVCGVRVAYLTEPHLMFLAGFKKKIESMKACPVSAGLFCVDGQVDVTR